ncbi:MAG: hypothetical protein JXR27_04495 [Paludibacteraceae bacterium]|nr:hypothetical protein [Paludibacteraceae bacterium]
MTQKISTKEKSVHINLHSNYYGSIAEIGGGQETARHLFQAGGASNTVAKTVSAYDKSFSDHFYNEGKPSRYVAQERLNKMIDYEYNELIQVLDKKIDQKFFAFANTVEILNYSKNNTGNGWIGIAIEGSERYKPNKILFHIKLLENDTLLQQQTLGTIGINLIFASLTEKPDPREIITALTDNLDKDRVEVDFVHVEGPDMKWYDNRLLNLLLVSNNMTPAVMFDENGQVQQPADMLYRKNVLLMRGHFRPISNLVLEFFEDSLEMFKRDEDYRPDNTIAFCEISLKYLFQNEKLDEKDFLHRVDLLNMAGKCVMVSNFYRYFKLVDYFAQFKMIKLRIVLGLNTFDRIFHESQYTDLRGGILEAMGTLFHENVKLYLYPFTNINSGDIIYPDDEHFHHEYKALWQYLRQTRKILVLNGISANQLRITPDRITKMIRRADEKLADYLPPKVYAHIKSEKLFGYDDESI